MVDADNPPGPPRRPRESARSLELEVAVRRLKHEGVTVEGGSADRLVEQPLSRVDVRAAALLRSGPVIGVSLPSTTSQVPSMPVLRR